MHLLKKKDNIRDNIKVNLAPTKSKNQVEKNYFLKCLPIFLARMSDKRFPLVRVSMSGFRSCAEAIRKTACRLSSLICAWSCLNSLLKTSVRTDRCSRTLTEHKQHDVGAVASNQGAGDGKSPGFQHPGT